MPNSQDVHNLVVIASSTGGPKSLQSVVPKLPGNLNAGVIIVQHMPSGFTNSLAIRLDDLSDIKVQEASEGDVIMNGNVYIAKGGMHLKVSEHHRKYYLNLSDEPPREGVRPCANYAFESLCNTSLSTIVCVVMTGMGADGTVGIQNLKNNRSIYTIGQDQSTSIIYGMPRSVYEAGLTDKVVPLTEIANEIVKKVGVL